MLSIVFIPTKEQSEQIAERYGTPVFVADRATITAQAQKLQQAFSRLPAKIFYSIKANFNPHIVKAVKDAGIYGIDAVSIAEVRLALDLGYAPEAVIYTPSNASTEEIIEVGNRSVLQNLGSLSELERFCSAFPGKEVSIRICPEVGAGEFEQMSTGELESKFGLTFPDIEEAKRICKAAGVTIVGVHSHIGSGFYEADAFKKSVKAICEVAGGLPDLRFIDVGGGFGVPYRPGQEGLDIEALAEAAAEIFMPFLATREEEVEFYLEPGKFLVAESTALLSRITTMKEKGGKVFVGLDTGFNHLIRPAMYGAYHHVVNVSKEKGNKRRVVVAGNLCETGDILNKDIELVDPEEGDLVAILVTGGHGIAMGSNYNMRGFAAEVFIDGDTITLTRRRQTYEDMVSLFTD